jgi:DNA-binding transcriptional MerR regulator
MHIGELAEHLDVSTKTLRHYEKIGLLPAPSRGVNGYRYYSAEAINQARTVVALRRLDLPIETIKELLYTGSRNTLRQRLLGSLDQKRQEIELQISVLQGRQEDLNARFMRLYRSPDTHPGHCICGLLNEPCSCAEPE